MTHKARAAGKRASSPKHTKRFRALDGIRTSTPLASGGELRSVVDIKRPKHPFMGATIVTDFQESLATGQMVGMILSFHAAANVHIITDMIDPFNITEGAFALREVVRHYPTPYAHIGVIDPGVGTDRKGICIRLKHRKTGGDVYLLGPDNGLFFPTMVENEVTGVVELQREEGPSSTFHGRDIFARNAGRLVAGVPFEKLGRKLDPLSLKDLDVSPNTFVHRDGFGNLKSLITSIEGLEIGKKYILQVPSGVYEFTMVRTYKDAPVGTLVGYMGSWGTLEIAVTQGDAARLIGVRSGDQFWINLQQKL